MKKLENPFLFAAKFLVLFFSVLILASCGGGSSAPVVITGPGLVGIDDVSPNEPFLIVTYTLSGVSNTVDIPSDLASDGDIEFDPVTGAYFFDQNPSKDLFGEDDSQADQPEFRAFQTFSLSTIPYSAQIVSATLDVVIDRVDFASTVPTFIDLVQYTTGPGGLVSGDFSAAPVTPQIQGGVNSIAFTFLSSDQTGPPVDIDVTPLMQEAQVQAFPDFQVRYVVQSLASGLRTSVKAKRATSPSPRSKIQIKRGTSSSNTGFSRPRTR
ncbi:MAG: hypothetical protein M0Z61_10965 [Nitrospiraceae bacterium]|nr:hypothetical protein [Nitrospiraceae bacterium]